MFLGSSKALDRCDCNWSGRLRPAAETSSMFMKFGLQIQGTEFESVLDLVFPTAVVLAIQLELRFALDLT